MTRHARLLTRLAQAITRLGADRPLTWRACHAVRDLLAADGASITLLASTPLRVTLCATDRISGMLENLQDVLGEGPCRDAFDSGSPVAALTDEPAAARWPQFIPAAEQLIGRNSGLWSLPMRSAGQRIGAVSLYRQAPGPLLLPMSAAQVLADAVAGELLTDPHAFAAITDLADDSGWSTRAVVQQAAGLIAGQLGITISDAMAILRSRAFATDAQLRDVAKDVVARKLDLSGG
jgi:ANTAR domain